MVSRSKASVLSDGQTCSARRNINQVDAPAATGTRFNLQPGMLLPQPIENVVKILRVAHPEILLLFGRNFRPARFAEVAVVIPLQERDVVHRNQLVEPVKDVVSNIVPSGPYIPGLQSGMFFSQRSIMSYRLRAYSTQSFRWLDGGTSGHPGSENERFTSDLR